MDWLLALFVAILPWFAVPHWLDASELPKILLSVGVMGIWFVLRGVYSVLGSLILEDGPEMPRRWSVFSVWIGALSLAVCGAWAFAPHSAIAWLGNGAQISSSALTLLIVLWLIAAIRDSVQRNSLSRRLLIRSWFIGMCIALFGTLFIRASNVEGAITNLFSAGRILDLWLLSPLGVMAGLGLLATRPIVEVPLTNNQLIRYRLSHAVLAVTLLGLLVGGLLVNLGWLWVVSLGATFVSLWRMMTPPTKRPRLALFLSLVALVAGLIGLGQVSGLFAMPTRLRVEQRRFGLEQLSEILPNQRLSWRVARTTLEDAPLFGAGPGGWVQAFDRARPLELNQTPLWDSVFPRGASTVTMLLTEYGLLPNLVFGAFLFILLLAALRKIKGDQGAGLIWDLLLVGVALGFVALRPPSVLSMVSLAFVLGLLSARVFPPAEGKVGWSERRAFAPALLGFCLLIAIGTSVTFLRRVAAAELLTVAAPYALPLARRLNPADDLTYAQEALWSFDQAEQAARSSAVSRVRSWLDQVDQALLMARTRNPERADYLSLALQSKVLRAQSDETAEEPALRLAEELDRARPTDPTSSLAVFTIQRLRVEREIRLVEQTEGRDKEAALLRQERATQAATAALQEALRRKPDYQPALYLQAAWLSETGNTAQSILALEQLARLKPNAPEIVLPLALLYRRTQEPLKAVNLLEQLVEGAPMNLEAQWQLSVALVQAERWEEATVVLQRLVAAAPREEQYQLQLKEVLRRRAQAAAPAPVIAVPAPATSTTSTLPIRSRTPARRTTR